MARASALDGAGVGLVKQKEYDYPQELLVSQRMGARALRSTEGLSYGRKDLEESGERAPAPFFHSRPWTLLSQTWARSTVHTPGFLPHLGLGTSFQPS